LDDASLRNLLEAVQAGNTDIDAAMMALEHLPYADLGFAKVDHHRQLRSGLAESVYAPGKSPEQVVVICRELLTQPDGAVVATRCDEAQAKAISACFPEAEIDASSGLAILRRASEQIDGSVIVVSAGTVDLPVANEALGTLIALGVDAQHVGDVGVAGLHRLLASAHLLKDASVIIAVAGMEGALASVVAGLASAPVIAVPTSTGYGTGLGGVAALMTMLNSCAPGLAVVNIDNGYGAAVFALSILLAKR